MSDRNRLMSLGTFSGVVVAVMVAALIFVLIFVPRSQVSDTPEVINLENISAEEPLSENDGIIGSEQNTANFSDTSHDVMSNVLAGSDQINQIPTNVDQQNENNVSIESSELDQGSISSVENDMKNLSPDANELNIVGSDEESSFDNQQVNARNSLSTDDSTKQSPISTSKDTVISDTLPPPVLDVLRVSRDGTVIVAGKSAVESTVDIFINSQITSSASVDARGNFVAVFLIPNSTEPRVLTLVARSDTQQAALADEFIIAPTGGDLIAESVTTNTLEDTVNDQSKNNSTQDMQQGNLPELSQSANVSILRIGEDGPELMSPDILYSAVDNTQIELETISYDTDNSVLLSGRSLPNSNVLIYMDEEFTVDSIADPAGRWNAKLSYIAPGNYRLRIDQLNDDHTVISRLETSLNKESRENLDKVRSTESSFPQEFPVAAVTIQRGDTLWAISRKRYGHGVLYVRIFEANRDSIRDPNLIYPGQIFTLPE
ncbi:MAG: LysM peptidoglycan-binding domain-containing protein [Aestuariivita sp.]|nr:LysM peptidoglycan-binding domain-containing protein [Aestuariivita sp.]